MPSSERFSDPSPQTHRQGCNVVRHFNLLWVAGECQQCVHHSQHPCIVCLRVLSDWDGGRVRNMWWQRGPAHCRRICHAACKSGTVGIASHSLASSFSLLFTTSSTNRVEATGVPKTFTPSGFQTSVPIQPSPPGTQTPDSTRASSLCEVGCLHEHATSLRGCHTLCECGSELGT